MPSVRAFSRMCSIPRSRFPRSRTLEATADSIVYATEAAGEARVWPYPDITSIGRIDPYTFRVSTRDETSLFDLKVAMTEEQYELLWVKVYR